MDNFGNKVLNYGFLLPDEQKAVDLYVLNHPEYEKMLEEVRALYTLIDETHILKDDTHQNNALAYYVAQESFLSTPVPESMSKMYNKLREEVENDYEVRDRYLAIKSQMEEIASQSNPLAQFEQLTGHNIDKIHRQTKTPALDHARKDRPASVREHKGLHRRWTRTGYYLLATSLAVFLFMMYLNKMERIAYLDLIEFYENTPSGLRGVESATEPGEGNIAPDKSVASSYNELRVQFNQGLTVLFNAQQSRYNLFFSYDLDAMSRAEKVFVEILGEENIKEPLIYDVKYALAKAYLAQHKTEEARAFLEELAQLETVWAADAARILDTL